MARLALLQQMCTQAWITVVSVFAAGVEGVRLPEWVATQKEPEVAYCINGLLRGFEKPPVYTSILKNVIDAFGGSLCQSLGV